MVARDNKGVGGTVDCWCGKCKMVLTHTIEALTGDKPARVQCNTCKAQHAYKAQAPAAPSAKRVGGGSRKNQYQSILKAKDSAQAKPYSSSTRYAPGDTIQHATFGFGVATAVKDDTKIEVLFEGGSKVLVHAR